MELSSLPHNGWLPGWDQLISAGGWAVLLGSLIITPGVPYLLALLTEHRLLRPSRDFYALVLGDLALAAAAGLSAGVIDDARLISPIWLAPPTGWFIPAAGLLFGLYQVLAELKTGFYTKAQAWSPSKLYHQFIIYPVHGYLLTATVTTALISPAQLLLKAAILIPLGLWAAALVHDMRHPKLGHAPFNWKCFAPLPQPWKQGSVSIQADSDWQKTHSARNP